MHSLTKTELTALLAAAKAHSQRSYVMIHVGFTHGLRASEVTEMTAEQVRSGYLTVQRLKGSEKTIQKCSQELVDYARGKTGILFPIKRRQLHNIFVACCAAARYVEDGETKTIPEHKWHFHVCKHTCGSLMNEGGARINEIQRRLGHASLASTGRYLVCSDDVADKSFAAAVGGM